MSLQIFLEGKILGVDDCLLAPASQDPDQVFTGRSHWISLLSEVLPRALLAELGLAKILIGSSGGGQGDHRAQCRGAQAGLEQDGKSGRLERCPAAIRGAARSRPPRARQRS